MPRFSVLVPTRDRPDLLAFCLESLAQQTFPDVEVIVADNPVEAAAGDVFERWRAEGWQYVKAPEPLTMHDNWERGLQHATGEFVAVVIDKTILQPRALELANRALEDDPEADLVSWWNDPYNPDDEAGAVGNGVLVPTSQTRDTERFDPAAELATMYALDHRRGTDPIHYYRGKIVFGAYSKALLGRIGDACGRVFYPFAPDYTSRIPALALTRGAIDIGRPLLVSYSSVRSNGRRTASRSSYAKRFVTGAAADALALLPIRGLYASQHNVVAHDYVTAAKRLRLDSIPELDRENLVRRAREDLELMEWDTPEDRDEQYAILEAEEARLGVTAHVPEADPVAEESPPTPRTIRSTSGDLLRKVPPAERAVRWALRRPVQPEPEPPPAPPSYTSPVDAARAADQLYTSDLDTLVGGAL
jgi:cellulose synthase/poly-beta-1,6-N-acetylglucosamine synthase-like glycosyltransferase